MIPCLAFVWGFWQSHAGPYAYKGKHFIDQVISQDPRSSYLVSFVSLYVMCARQGHIWVRGVEQTSKQAGEVYLKAFVWLDALLVSYHNLTFCCNF